MKTLLIDGDIAIYQIAVAVEEPFDWGDDLWTLHSDASEAKQRLDYWIKNLMEKFNAGRCIFALTSGDNWRNKVMPS
jgi:DNA polymerase-1